MIMSRTAGRPHTDARPRGYPVASATSPSGTAEAGKNTQRWIAVVGGRRSPRYGAGAILRVGGFISSTWGQRLRRHGVEILEKGCGGGRSAEPQLRERESKSDIDADTGCSTQRTRAAPNGLAMPLRHVRCGIKDQTQRQRFRNEDIPQPTQRHTFQIRHMPENPTHSHKIQHIWVLFQK